MKKRIALSKTKTLFGLSTDQLKLVVGGGGVIVQSEEPRVNGVGTSPSGSEEVQK